MQETLTEKCTRYVDALNGQANGCGQHIIDGVQSHTFLHYIRKEFGEAVADAEIDRIFAERREQAKNIMTPRMAAAVEMIKGEGYSVYMRNRSDNYAYYTDGTRIAYFEFCNLRGWRVSTVHKPNTRTGTGLSALDGVTLDEFKQHIAECFHAYPAWVSRSDLEKIVKFKSWDEFAKLDKWNSEFKLV